MAKSESAIQRKIIEWLEDEKKCIVIKITTNRGQGVVGWPDLLVLPPPTDPNKAFFVEVKTISGVVSKIQNVRFEQLENQGFNVCVAVCLSDLKKWWEYPIWA